MHIHRCVSYIVYTERGVAWLALTEESYHSICSPSDEQVAVVVEGHAMDANRQRLYGQ